MRDSPYMKPFTIHNTIVLMKNLVPLTKEHLTQNKYPTLIYGSIVVKMFKI